MHSMRDVVAKLDETVGAMRIFLADFTGSAEDRYQVDRLIEHLESEARQMSVDWDGPNVVDELALDDFYKPST